MDKIQRILAYLIIVPILFTVIVLLAPNQDFWLIVVVVSVLVWMFAWMAVWVMREHDDLSE